jgi:hypothetical protein
MRTAAIALFATALHVAVHQTSAWIVQPAAFKAQCKRNCRSRSLSTVLAARQQTPEEQVKDLLTDQAVATVRAYWHAMRGSCSHQHRTLQLAAGLSAACALIALVC